MSTAKLLDRLDRVKSTGPGKWIARCPAHEDRSPSLSIREVEGGRVLVKDFGGCEVGDILSAVGLTFSDLFAEGALKGSGAAGGFAPSHSKIPARDLLEIVSEELNVVAILAADLLAHKSISEADWIRLATASNRIWRARDHVR